MADKTTNDQNPLTIVVPRWGNVFTYDGIAPDNLELINEEDRARRLTRAERKTINRSKKELERLLRDNQYQTIRARYDVCVGRFRELKQKRAAMDDVPDTLLHQMKRWKQRGAQEYEKLEPLKKYAARLRYLERREVEHEAALQFEARERADRDQMLREVSHYANRIQERYAQLKFREDITRGDKHIRYVVEFEDCVVTEDEIIFKIDVSRVTLFGSSRNRLPDGVRVRELVKRETLDELAAACERPIWSPHNEQEAGGFNMDFSNGAWIVISRLEMRHSVPKYIELRHLMAKYRQVDRHKFPMPFGVRRGRKINWGYINNSSPHFMINGLTGSGKTNVIVGCVTTLIQMNSPDEIRLVMTDLKRGGDFRPFASAPHNLMDGIIFTPRDLEETLQRLTALLYIRQDRIGQIAVDIGEYNKLVPYDRQLARVLVIIDEYSETKDLGGDKTVKLAIDRYVNSIARLGRAAGIHLMIGNQQPYQENIPSEVKANITYHLTGYQMTLGASFSTVGNNSATKLEKLPGRMMVNTGVEIFETQQALVTPEDINHALETARHWPTPRPFDWPGIEISEGIIEQYQPQEFNLDTLAAIAIEEFDGSLSQHRIYQYARNNEFEISRPAIAKMIKSLALLKSITYQGKLYNVEVYGHGWRLVGEKIKTTGNGRYTDVQPDPLEDAPYIPCISPVYQEESTE